jgi:hypothetical protein
MIPEERAPLIQQYADGHQEVVNALKNFPPDKLGDHPIAGKWSAKEIVHHLADSEGTSAIRLRRLLVEDNPVIQGYDEAEYAIRLRYNERDIAPALDAFKAARATTSQLLALMSEQDWQKPGTHSESGAYTAEHWLKIYAAHAHNHAAQIKRLKDMLNT